MFFLIERDSNLFTEFCRGFNGFESLLPGFTGFYRVLQERCGGFAGLPRIGRKRKFSSPLSLSLFLWFWGLFFFGFASFLVFWFCFKRQTTFPAGSFVCVCVCVCLCVLDEGPVRWTSGARSPANESLPLFFPFRSVPPGPSPPFSFNSSPSVSLTNDNEERNNRTIVWIQNAVTNSIRCRNCISHRRPSWLGLATHRTGHLIGCRLLAGFVQIPSINPCSDVFFLYVFFFAVTSLSANQSGRAASFVEDAANHGRASFKVDATPFWNFQQRRHRFLSTWCFPLYLILEETFAVRVINYVFGSSLSVIALICNDIQQFPHFIRDGLLEIVFFPLQFSCVGSSFFIPYSVRCYRVSLILGFRYYFQKIVLQVEPR